MKKIKLERTIQQRPSSRKQQRNEKIREQLNEHIEVQVIPALEDRDDYVKRKHNPERQQSKDCCRFTI